MKEHSDDVFKLNIIKQILSNTNVCLYQSFVIWVDFKAYIMTTGHDSGAGGSACTHEGVQNYPPPCSS